MFTFYFLVLFLRSGSKILELCNFFHTFGVLQKQKSKNRNQLMVEIKNFNDDVHLKSEFERVVQHCKSTAGCSILSYNYGDISQSVMDTMIRNAENALKTHISSKNILKRVYTIVIEGIQNIYQHGSVNQNNEKLGGFILAINKKEIHIHFMNITSLERVQIMSQYIRKLNNMTIEEAKELYMETLENIELTEKGGASLGCILMRLKSSSPIAFLSNHNGDNLAMIHLKVALEN